jgi:hypothetical protein
LGKSDDLLRSAHARLPQTGGIVRRHWSLHVSGEKEKKNIWAYVIRWAIASILLLALCIYVVCILSGKIEDPHKLGGADVGIILVIVLAVVVLLQPGLLNRLTDLKFGGFELTLRELQADQQLQRGELDGIRFVLTLLLQKREQDHLSNLEEGKTKTQDYHGNAALCSELRNLRTLGLIKNLSGRTIAELEKKQTFDLMNFVELTDRGREYLEWSREHTGKQSEEIK